MGAGLRVGAALSSGREAVNLAVFALSLFFIVLRYCLMPAGKFPCPLRHLTASRLIVSCHAKIKSSVVVHLCPAGVFFLYIKKP